MEKLHGHSYLFVTQQGSDGVRRLYLQVRAEEKDNPGLLDKFGGHVRVMGQDPPHFPCSIEDVVSDSSFPDCFAETAADEREELGLQNKDVAIVPIRDYKAYVAFVNSGGDPEVYRSSFLPMSQLSLFPDIEDDKQLSDLDLTQTLILSELAYLRNYTSARVPPGGGEKRGEPVHVKVYLGTYQGDITGSMSPDSEVGEIDLYDRKSIDRLLITSPDRFSEDLKFLLKLYEPYIFGQRPLPKASFQRNLKK